MVFWKYYGKRRKCWFSFLLVKNCLIWATLKTLSIWFWIVCIVFNAIFNNISVISQQPVHLSMLSWEFFWLVLHTIFFPSHWLLSNITIVEKTDSSERGMNPVALTINNPRKEYWPRWGLNQRPPVLKSAALLTFQFGQSCNFVICWRINQFDRSKAVFLIFV